MDEDGNANIYEDLPDFRYDETLDQLNASIAKLQVENHVLQTRLVRAIEEKRVLERNCNVLNTNISSLLKTAKLEIKRKERTIVELREQLNKVMPRKHQFGLKRRRETTVTPSPRKKPRFSPRKSRESRPLPREDRSRSHKKGERRCSKPEVVGSLNRHDRVVRDETPNHVENERHNHSASEKENEPAKDVVVVKEPLLNGICAAPCGTSVDPSPTTAPPVLPALECPTLFSSRMYKRLYGKDPALVTTGDTVPASDSFQPAVAGESPKPSKLLKSGRRSPPNRGSSRQLPSSCSHVTPDDIRTYLEFDDSLQSYRSLSSSPVEFECKPVATSYVKPQNCNPVSSVVTRTIIEHEPLKQHEVPPKKLEVSISQLSAVEIPPIHSAPPEETKNLSSKVNVLQTSAKSPVAKVGLLAVGKPRQQTVAIRPIQKLDAEESSRVFENLDKNSLVAQERNSSAENSPETNTSAGSAEKANRHLKIPRLSGSTKVRTVRPVFAPISNQWNSTLPNCSDQSDHDKKETSELSVAKTVPVTSELTVRVIDLKQDELNPQSLFGSPVKWADDSLGSPVTEEPAKSRKLYSIFGSPFIDRSSSSEHPFSVPPGAYEDSCWTNHISEKVSTKSAGEADPQKQTSLEPVPLGEPKPKENSSESNGAEKVTTKSPVCPPPSLTAVKKHASIFSPVKDSRHSVTSKMPDEPSRSNTGICFPFTRYEDSVLGQFDDTAQFVSALAKVDTKISPLNTPVKSGDREDIQSTVQINPTSFEQVFKKNIPVESKENHNPPNVGNFNDEIGAEKNSDQSVPKVSSNEEHFADAPHQTLLSGQTTDNHETENVEIKIGNSDNAQPRKTDEPPKITVTPPKSEPSLRLIHRPNFASSTILCVKSWFPNDPVKVVTPRKTPRLVSNANRSASPKGLDMSAGAKIAINDAFIIEQEERVRRWELDHLYENTLTCGSRSPSKSLNGSPSRKRVESSGKISPSKRTPRKQVSPRKSSRRPEPHRNPAVETIPCPSSADTAGYRVAENKEPTMKQPAPGSATAIASVAVSPEVVSSQTSVEPTNSLLNPTQKLLAMLNGLTLNVKHVEPGLQSSSGEASKPEAKVAPRSVDLSSVSVKAQCEHKFIDPNELSDNLGPKPHRSTLEREVVPSQATGIVVKSCAGAVDEEMCPKNSSNEQVLSANPLDSTDLPRIPPPCTPLLFEDKSVPLPVGSADSAVLPRRSSTVTSAKSANPSLSGKDYSVTSSRVETSKEQVKLIRSIDSTGLVPTDPSSSTGSADFHTNTPSGDLDKLNGTPKEKTVPRPLKYSAIISRVKPTTPLNKSVAALITSSMTPTSSPLPRSRLSVSTPTVQSTKEKSSFKRSSALKPKTGKGAANSLINSIRATFFQGTPTSSAKATSSGARVSPKPNIQHRGILRKGTNEVTVKRDIRTPLVTLSQKKESCHATSETAVFDHVARSEAEMKRNSLDQWKLFEVHQPPKPISLLKRFKEAQGTDDGDHVTVSNAVTDNLNSGAEKNVKSSAVVQEGAKRKPELEPMQISSPVLNGVSEIVCQALLESQVISKSDGVKVVSQDTVNRPSKSQCFPRSSSRKTILLDSPMKMSTPTKRKTRSGESVETPKPDDKCVETSSRDTPKTTTASKGIIPAEKNSPRVLKDKGSESERASRHTEYRQQRSKLDASCETSSRESRRSRESKRNESPTRSPRCKSHSAYHKSPEGSPARREAMKPEEYRSKHKESEINATCELSSRKLRRSERDESPTPHQRRKSCSAHRKSPEGSPARGAEAMKPNRSKHNESESRPACEISSRKLRRSKRESPTPHQRRKSHSAHRKSPERSPEAMKPDRYCKKNTESKRITSDSSDGKPSSERKFKSSSKPSELKHQIASSRSDIENPIMEVMSRAPRPKTADSSSTSTKAISCHPRSKGVTPSAQISPASNALETPIPFGNRKANFGFTSATKPTEIVISVGKRPALFRPT